MSSMVTDKVRADVRAFVESNMLDAVHITRPPAQVLDEDTLVASNTPGAEVYTGPARLKLLSPSTLATGEGPIAQDLGSVSIPYGSADPQVDDLLVVTAAVDGRQVGRALRITGIGGGGVFADKIDLQVAAWTKSSRWTGAS